VTRRNEEERIWVGTLGGGLAYRGAARDREPWTVLSTQTAPALPNDSIYQLREDRDGRIYAFSNKGVARLVAETNGAATFRVDTFGTEDGLPSKGFVQGSSLVDSAGRIWGGTVLGIAVFDPAREQRDRQAPLRDAHHGDKGAALRPSRT
jgi:ligand-binding sensor domain-containing protein